MGKYHLACAVLAAFASHTLFAASIPLVQTNLVSDLSTEGAATVDAHLKNPWGMSFSATSPFWISNQVSNDSTLYTGAGAAISAINVTVLGGPTGQVFNSAGKGNFVVNGSASAFIFDTLAGTIDAWNGSLGLKGTAQNVVSTAGAVYTGLAIGKSGSSNYLYAANFINGGGINVFDSSFAQVNATTFAGKFVDPSLPAGYAPFNIQLVGNDLYVEYAKVGAGGMAARGLGLGFVDKFNTSGVLIQRVVSNGPLDAPWGVTIAPAGFGQFGGDLLVGNFGNGEINVFTPGGTFVTTLDGANGKPFVNQDLWALDFRPNGAADSNFDALYFTAGINKQADGLFGYIAPAPEPSVYETVAGGLLLIGGVVSFRRRKAHAQSLGPQKG